MTAPAAGTGEVQGKTCVLTGAAGGIGRVMAQRFAAAGARVYAVDRQAAQFTHAGIIALACDLRQAADIQAVFDRIGREAGRVDILVNNAAATIPKAPVTGLSPADWDEAIAVNLTAAFHTCRLAIPLMRPGSSIINVASQLARVGKRHGATYSTTKAALVAFSRGLAIDHADQGIRVNSLSPGAIDTPRATRGFPSSEAAEAALGPLHLLGRLGRADEVAEAALFLASDRASFITGSDMLVDGGYCAR